MVSSKNEAFGKFNFELHEVFKIFVGIEVKILIKLGGLRRWRMQYEEEPEHSKEGFTQNKTTKKRQAMTNVSSRYHRGYQKIIIGNWKAAVRSAWKQKLDSST